MSLYRRSDTVVVFCGRLACVMTLEGRFLALAGIGFAEHEDRIGQGGNRKDVAFLVTAEGEWMIGGQPKAQMLVSEKKRRRFYRGRVSNTGE